MPPIRRSTPGGTSARDSPRRWFFFGTEDTWLRHWKNLTQYSIRPRGGAEPVVWYVEGGDHGVLLKPEWRLACLAAADRFLVERGFLTGESPLPRPADGRALVSASPRN